MASVFDLPELTPYREGWRARCARYALYRAYYNGTAYDKLRGITAARKLYEGTRTLFSPLRRVVAVDCAKIPAAWALADDAPARMVAEVAALRRRLDAEQVYARYLKYGAVAGEAAIVVSGRPGAEVLTAHRLMRSSLARSMELHLASSSKWGKLMQKGGSSGRS
jgi:hypothetical protein